MVSNGVGRKVIASSLGISVNTVNSYVESIADKIGGEGRPTARIIRYVLTNAA